MKVLQVCPTAPAGAVSGIHQHAERLTEQLSRTGHEVQLVDPREQPIGAFDVAHLHYVPFAFRAWGVGAVPLVRRLARLAPLVVTIHETRLAYTLAPRSVVMSPLQDAVLRYVLGVSRIAVLPTEAHRGRVGRVRAKFVPSGSVLPLDFMPPRRGVGSPLRLGIVTSGHPDRMQHVAADVCRTAARTRSCELVALGPGDVPGFRTTGLLDSTAFARELAQLHVAVLPYADGVSGRRTSFASALQAGVATVTTLRLPMTDFPTGDGAFAATPIGEAGGLASALASLCDDSAGRNEMAARGRQLFDTHLSWPVLARRLTDIYALARS